MMLIISVSRGTRKSSVIEPHVVEPYWWTTPPHNRLHQKYRMIVVIVCAVCSVCTVWCVLSILSVLSDGVPLDLSFRMLGHAMSWVSPRSVVLYVAMGEKPLLSGRKWFLRWVSEGFDGYVVLKGVFGIQFRWSEVPLPRYLNSHVFVLASKGHAHTKI